MSILSVFLREGSGNHSMHAELGQLSRRLKELGAVHSATYIDPMNMCYCAEGRFADLNTLEQAQVMVTLEYSNIYRTVVVQESDEP